MGADLPFVITVILDEHRKEGHQGCVSEFGQALRWRVMRLKPLESRVPCWPLAYPPPWVPLCWLLLSPSLARKVMLRWP